jgi:hypothetical protein
MWHAASYEWIKSCVGTVPLIKASFKHFLQVLYGLTKLYLNLG